jgi:hypothetical protein
MRHFFAVAGVLLAAACGDGSGPSNVIPEELAGDWVAEPACLYTCGFTITPVATPADSVNVIASYGITMDLSLSRSGRLELVALGGGPVEPITGQARVEGQMLIVTSGTAVDTIDYQLAGSSLAFAFRELITLNGAPSEVRGVFVRR